MLVHHCSRSVEVTTGVLTGDGVCVGRFSTASTALVRCIAFLGRFANVPPIGRQTTALSRLEGQLRIVHGVLPDCTMQ